MGLRDHAILLLLARLGLRCAEVAALTLNDVDWRRAQITVHGKRNIVETMPLLSDVGEAVAAYLVHARPKTTVPNLFLRVRAPRRAMALGGRRGCPRRVDPCWPDETGHRSPAASQPGHRSAAVRFLVVDGGAGTSAS